MPKNTARLLVFAVIAVVLVGAGAAAFVWFSGGDGTASTPITAPTLEPVAAVETTPEAAATVEAAADAAATPEAETAAAPAGEAVPTGNAVTFNIVPDESQVRFLLDEDLQGQRITVTGTTNQIAGQIRVNFADPGSAEVGTIRINMRTLATDNQFRDRAIRGQILRTNAPENEFSDFVPTAVTGLPDTVTIGEPFTFQIAGDFIVLGEPRPLTFDVTVTPVSETRLEGQARAVINRNDWGLTIPSVPGVANVEEEVELEIDFIATT